VDVTERKRSEEALVRLSMAVGQSADAIVITDPDGTIEYVKPALERISGYTLEEVMGRNIAIFSGERADDEIYGKMWRAIREREGLKGKLVNLGRTGRRSRSRPRSPGLGTRQEDRQFVSRRWESRRNPAPDQIRAAQRLEAVGALAGGIKRTTSTSPSRGYWLHGSRHGDGGRNAEVLSCLAEIRKCSERASP
jgi:PAS domain-containing protein